MTTSKEAKAAYDRTRRAAKHDELIAKERARRAARSPDERQAANAYLRDYRRDNSERIRAQNRRYHLIGYQKAWRAAKRAEDPEAWRRQQQAIRMKSVYGITLAEFEGRLAAQGGVCAICHQPETMRIRGTLCLLAVDHDRSCCPGRKSCGKCVRGLLCVRCNMILGGALDDPAILRAAVAYLRR